MKSKILKNENGMTLTGLVITGIIAMIILSVCISIGLGMWENKLYEKELENNTTSNSVV